MRLFSLILVPAGIVSLALLAPGVSRAEAESQVGSMFTARCATCHTVPDTGLRSDRAWLAQVNRTS